MHLDHEDVEDGPENCADVRTNDWDPEVKAAMLEGFGSVDNRLENSGSEVSGGIDGETGVCSEGESDAENDEPYQNRDQSFMRTHVLWIGERHNTNNKKKTTENLISESHLSGGAFKWPCSPNAEVRRSARQESTVDCVDDDGGEEGADILADEIERHQIPVEATNDSHGQSHGRIDVPSTDATTSVNSECNAAEEAPVDGEVRVKRPFRDDCLSNGSIPKSHQQKRPQHLRQKTSDCETFDAFGGEFLRPRHCPLYRLKGRANEAGGVAVGRAAATNAGARARASLTDV